MVNIKYRIERLGEHLFGVVVPDDYDRSMLFLRAQEYIESPSTRFRGKSFDIWTFIKWYSIQQSDPDSGFTYAKDWAGFNFPLSTALECYAKLRPEMVTSYDQVFLEMIDHILRRVGRDSDIKKTYVIAYDKPRSVTMKHELKHAAYFLDPKYRRLANKLIRELPHSLYDTLARNLRIMGYHKSQRNSEMHAYLVTRSDWNSPEFSKNTNKKMLKRVHQMFKAELEQGFKDFLETLNL